MDDERRSSAAACTALGVEVTKVTSAWGEWSRNTAAQASPSRFPRVMILFPEVAMLVRHGPSSYQRLDLRITSDNDGARIFRMQHDD
jgi:hypothetical protein